MGASDKVSNNAPGRLIIPNERKSTISSEVTPKKAHFYVSKNIDNKILLYVCKFVKK